MRMKKPFDKYEFEVSPAVVNAFYSPEKNALSKYSCQANVPLYCLNQFYST